MSESKVASYGAIAANVAIATTKFIVAGFPHSSAMLCEGIHSAVDTGNGVLLLVGLHLSQRPPCELHPYGHGKELFFWGLIAAVPIFGIEAACLSAPGCAARRLGADPRSHPRFSSPCSGSS